MLALVVGIGTYLYYFRGNSKHLFRYNLSTEQETDLMAGFVPVEPEKVITTYYAKTQTVGNDVYYINMRDGGKLYRYNAIADSDSRITSNEVADFAVVDGYLYYSTVRLRTNFDFYRMNLTTGENELLSNGKCVNYAFDDTYIYYNSMSGSNTLNRMKLDGSEDTVLFSAKSTDWNQITLYQNKVYFVASDTLYAYDLATETAAVVNSNLCPLEYLMQAVSKWENDLAQPDLTALKRLAELYNVPVSQLIDASDEQATETPAPEPAQEPAVKYVEVPQKPVLAVCEDCNKPIYDADDIVRTTERHGKTSVKVVYCSVCAKKRDRKKAENELYEAQKANPLLHALRDLSLDLGHPRIGFDASASGSLGRGQVQDFAR